MKNRRGFLTALTAMSGAAVGLSVAARTDSPAAGAATPPPADPPATPPKAVASPTPAALAIAATFRHFDAALSDTEIHAIARQIDENRSGAVLNPKKKPLRNSDEMVARFAADERFV